MKRGLTLGLAWGIPLGMGAVIYLEHLEARAEQATRAPGATVVNLKGRDIEAAINRHRRETGRERLA